MKYVFLLLSVFHLATALSAQECPHQSVTIEGLEDAALQHSIRNGIELLLEGKIIGSLYIEIDSSTKVRLSTDTVLTDELQSAIRNYFSSFDWDYLRETMTVNINISCS